MADLTKVKQEPLDYDSGDEKIENIEKNDKMIDESRIKVEIKEEPKSDNEENHIDDKIQDAGDGIAKMSIKQEQRGEDFQKLLEYGLDERVAVSLDDIYKTGKLEHEDLDDRALDALKEFPVDGAIAVLGQFLESNLEHVSNKSAYLCGVMKTYRQKSRSANNEQVSPGSNGLAGLAGRGGPDEDKINAILKRTGYTLDVTTGQRKYGGPPPDWKGEAPGYGCEVFCGKIPRDLYEDELIPLFEKCGTIWDLRLMMDPMTGLNRGYAFVTFTERDAAQEAVDQLNSHDLGEDGKVLKVNISEPKTRLFVGNIPKNKDKDEIEDHFKKIAAGLREVIIYSSPDDKKKNRGFCFLEYESHKAASLAKRRLETGRVKVWSCDIIVDWADPQEEPDDQIMSQVKVLYVRNLTQAVTEETLREVFEAHGQVERVKKIKDYAFVHFVDRQMACDALKALNQQDLAGAPLQISLAKPPSDKKKKEETLRKREQRMLKNMNTHGMPLPPFPPFPSPFGPIHAGMPLFRPGNPMGRGGHHHHQGNSRGNMNPGGLRHHHHHPQVYGNGYYWGHPGWADDANWNHHHQAQVAAHAQGQQNPRQNSGANNNPWMGGNGEWGANRGGANWNNGGANYANNKKAAKKA